MYVLSFKPAIPPYGKHDPSAALFEDGHLVFATEEERYTRKKHAVGKFPSNAIRECLDYANISLSEVDKIILPYDPSLDAKQIGADFRKIIEYDNHPAARVYDVIYQLKEHARSRFFPDIDVKHKLEELGSPIPKIEHRSHHKCHAASAFHPTEFDEATVFTIDGIGEYDSTVVWEANSSGLERRQTFEYPNSLGHFYGIITEYLGYRAMNGEGKVMGLAPYGEQNDEVESKLRSACDFGVEYDVTSLTSAGIDTGVGRLENLLDQSPNNKKRDIDQFYRDVAFTAQMLLEETVSEIVSHFVSDSKTGCVGLAGGVVMNCKMNKRIRELDCVDELFIQPVAHDGGLALGAGWLEEAPEDIQPMTDVYWGPSSTGSDIKKVLEENKISYRQSDSVESYVAKKLADGKLVGWMQGRQEMGPRALGNRSILADPRTSESLDRVNKYVKHREEWRPFAPSMLEEAAEKYLANEASSPYMIQTFDTDPEHRDEIEAVIHPGDYTTRPQTVREDQNPRYYRLISEFSELTGVPVVLNTSFNDHGEPIVTRPIEAIRDFYGMGLDILAIEDYIIEK